MKRTFPTLAVALAMALVAGACGDDGGETAKGGSAGSDKPAVLVGMIGARVGPVASAGVGVGDAIADWFQYVNANGGINGRKVELKEIESEYQVPKGIEAYSKLKSDGMAVALVAGTALSDALTGPSSTDQIPIVFPGQGNAGAVEGKKFPYAFPGAPTYPHQAAAAVKFLLDEWTTAGKTGKPRIVCLGWEPPPGQEYCAAVKASSEAVGATWVKQVTIPARAADVKPQILEAKASNPDFVFHSTLFSLAVAVMKTACAEGLGNKLVTWHWAVSENELNGAGAQCAEGLTGTAMGKLAASNPEPLKKLKDAAAKGTVRLSASAGNNQLYTNGLIAALLISEALRNADAKVGDGKITGSDVKAGFEQIRDFTGDGILCPTTITAENHGGNRALNIYRIKGGAFTPVTDCIEGPKLAGIEPQLG
jgi:branched-chain amino acid transport system substrate-binding protein